MSQTETDTGKESSHSLPRSLSTAASAGDTIKPEAMNSIHSKLVAGNRLLEVPLLASRVFISRKVHLAARAPKQIQILPCGTCMPQQCLPQAQVTTSASSFLVYKTIILKPTLNHQPIVNLKQPQSFIDSPARDLYKSFCTCVLAWLPAPFYLPSHNWTANYQIQVFCPSMTLLWGDSAELMEGFLFCPGSLIYKYKV